MEPFYPLHAYVCDECLLVQLEEFESPQAIFGDYAYFSSYSDTWLEHARRYVGMMVDRFGLGQQSQVVEVASNDGYLLQYFVERGIPALGIEPAGNVAEKAIAKGIPTDVAFFGVETARRLANQGRRADLLVGNNVLAHVPDINDFVGRDQDPARSERHRYDGIPAPAAVDYTATSSTRSTTSTSRISRC